jgi:hypothetical protein
VTEFARSKGLARGEWIREVILGEVCGASASDSSLAEILGVRLQARGSRRKRSTNCSSKSATRSTSSQASWLQPRHGIGDSRGHLGPTKTRVVYLTAGGID